MTLLGEFALWISLPVALWGMVLGYAGGKTQRGDLVLSAERSIYAVFFLHLIASAGVMAAFLGDRFEYWYVASYSNAQLEFFYKVTGLWAGQRGSLLFWALLLGGFFSSLCVFQNRKKHREFMPYVAAVLQTILAFFVIVLLFADVNPFERLGFTAVDGRGLNPQLQNYWMVIHPPTLYLGFTAFTIPFAFADRGAPERPPRRPLDPAHPQVDPHELALPLGRDRFRDGAGRTRSWVGVGIGSGIRWRTRRYSRGSRRRRSCIRSRSRRTAAC